MIRITNKLRSPIPIIVRSSDNPRGFTVKNIPGIGAGKNVFEMPDEMYTDYIERLRALKMISKEVF